MLSWLSEEELEETDADKGHESDELFSAFKGACFFGDSFFYSRSFLFMRSLSVSYFSSTAFTGLGFAPSYMICLWISVGFW